ncbi:MAG: serine acetyltransferase, partial [Eubacterium sp.]|nr:serine acetyltransferase [Eubacterium sp.]
MEEHKLKEEVKQIVDDILHDYEGNRDIDKRIVDSQPDKDAVVDILNKLMHIIFPGYFRSKVYKSYNDDYRLSVLIEDVIYNLRKQIKIALLHRLDNVEGNEKYSYEELSNKAEELTLSFFRKIPKIREYADTDVQATFDGDPAAFDKEEIVLSYPGLRATIINRIAHELYLLDVPLIPRIMTEYAHSRTGI